MSSADIAVLVFLRVVVNVNMLMGLELFIVVYHCCDVREFHFVCRILGPQTKLINYTPMYYQLPEDLFLTSHFLLYHSSLCSLELENEMLSIFF